MSEENGNANGNGCSNVLVWIVIYVILCMLSGC